MHQLIAHDVAQHKSYRKKRGILINDVIAYMAVRDAAIKAAAEAEEAAAAAAAAPPDMRDAQLAALRVRVQQLTSALDATEWSETHLKHTLADVREHLSDVIDDNHRLTALLYKHGYERPYVVPSSQPLISTYITQRSGSSSKRESKRQRNA